jgi:hypothetical protein
MLAHARKVEPVTRLAKALGDQGRGAFASIYGGLRVDEKQGTATLYATDPAKAAQLIAAARRADPGIDTRRITVRHAAYSRKVLNAELGKIMPLGTVKPRTARASGPKIYTAAPKADGSGLTVGVDKADLAAAKQQRRALAGAIPVTYVAAKPVSAASWRWNDSRPQIGGDVLIGKGRPANTKMMCTAGIAAEDKNHRDYLVTAAHCFPVGAKVYGEGGDTPGKWTYTNGNYIGTVTADREQWDAAIIDTGLHNGKGANSATADTPHGRWYPVGSAGYSYNGQSVCHDGAKSYYNGRGVPCGITVTDEDIHYEESWPDGSLHNVRGVRGEGGYGMTHGDSGALVFAVHGDKREARGMASALANDNPSGAMFWTEAPDILKSFGLTLNPHQ